jgi:hypothetical protein
VTLALRRNRSNTPDVPGYRVIRVAGSGGFSDVFQADDMDRSRYVALKVFRQRDKETRARVDAEVALGAQLAGAPGVAAALGRTATKDGRPVIVLPWYDLGTGADLLADERRLPVQDVVDLVRQVGRGLQAMHRLHVLHRDVSPRNILRSTELGGAIGDLGCARAVNATDRSAATEALTRGYAAPESARPGTSQTFASDAYGLAATAWALLAGEPPHGRPPARVAAELTARYELRRASGPPPRDALEARGVPPGVIAVLRDALHPEPEARPSISELADELVSVIGGHGGPTAAPTSAGRQPGGDPLAIGPLAPPWADAVPVAPPTTTGAPPAAATRDKRRRRRLRPVAVVLGCFVAAFGAASLLDDESGGAAGGTGGAVPEQPAAPLLAPRDLRITPGTGRRATLTWRPPAVPTDVLATVHRSVDGGASRRLPLLVDIASGRQVVTLDGDGRRYCFELVLTRGVEEPVASNPACIEPGRAR